MLYNMFLYFACFYHIFFVYLYSIQLVTYYLFYYSHFKFTIMTITRNVINLLHGETKKIISAKSYFYHPKDSTIILYFEEEEIAFWECSNISGAIAFLDFHKIKRLT